MLATALRQVHRDRLHVSTNSTTSTTLGPYAKSIYLWTNGVSSCLYVRLDLLLVDVVDTVVVCVVTRRTPSHPTI